MISPPLPLPSYTFRCPSHSTLSPAHCIGLLPPSPLSECPPHPNLAQHPVLVIPSSGMPLSPCLGSESPHQAALLSPLLQVHHRHSVGSLVHAAGHSHAWMSSLHLGSDTSRWATFLRRCPPHPDQVLTSCSESLRGIPPYCGQVPCSTPSNGFRTELFREGREGKKKTFKF